MHGAAAYFEHKLGIPTQLVNPFEGEAIAPSGIALEQLDAGARWATVLGNALAPLGDGAAVRCACRRVGTRRRARRSGIRRRLWLSST
jgi:hypothetical protein